jgi:hypothetical protein
VARIQTESSVSSFSLWNDQTRKVVIAAVSPSDEARCIVGPPNHYSPIQRFIGGQANDHVGDFFRLQQCRRHTMCRALGRRERLPVLQCAARRDPSWRQTVHPDLHLLG